MSPDNPNSESAAGQPSHPLQSVDVPVFNCIVYVSPDPSGKVHARVANLPELECTAANERDALRQIVSAFKKRVGELLHNNTPVPWITPPVPAESNEASRHIAVHL